MLKEVFDRVATIFAALTNLNVCITILQELQMGNSERLKVTTYKRDEGHLTLG